MKIRDLSIQTAGDARHDKSRLVDDMSVADFLAEPLKGSKEWLISVGRRLIGASGRPVLVGDHDVEVAARFERAGWPIVGKNANLGEVRKAFWPNAKKIRDLGGFGSLRPKIVLVGENSSAKDQVPFISKTGRYLYRALRAIGVDELTIHVTNALTVARSRRTEELKELYELFQEVEPVWISVGRIAHECLGSCGIPHGQISHPSHWQRWRAKKNGGLEGYAATIVQAGAPKSKLLVTGFKVNELPDLPGCYSPATLLEGKRSDAKPGGGMREHSLGAENLEKARRMFVIEGLSNPEIAKRIGVHRSRVAQACSHGQWKTEREEYNRQLTEEAKRAATRAEAKAAASCRRLAWTAAEKALQSITKRLGSGQYKPSPFEVQALARTAMDLADRVQDPEEERPEFNKLSLRELIEQVKEKAERNLGGVRAKDSQ